MLHSPARPGATRTRCLGRGALRPHSTANAGARVAHCRSYLQQIAELLGDTAGDPGHWNLSPEWYGSQGGGWGRDPGSTVFYGQSQHGNGLVTVTAHPASSSSDSSQAGGGEEEWRVLRFNQDTRQSVNRVRLARSGTTKGPASTRIVPQCLAWPYLKVMASAGVVVLAQHPELLKAATTPPPAGTPLPPDAPHIVCVGLGGGTLPACLAHHLAGALVTAVELDPLVVEAALQWMGLQGALPNLAIVEGDAADYMQELAGRAPGSVAQVYIDAFDGQDQVPQQLCTAGEPFMEHLATALHQQHGSLLINLHSEGSRSLPAADQLRIAMGLQPDGGYDTAQPLGRRIAQIGATFKAALLPGGAGAPGGAFTAADKYGGGNVTAVVGRGLQLPADHKAASALLQASGAAAGAQARFVFKADQILAKTALL